MAKIKNLFSTPPERSSKARHVNATKLRVGMHSMNAGAHARLASCAGRQINRRQSVVRAGATALAAVASARHK